MGRLTKKMKKKKNEIKWFIIIVNHTEWVPQNIPNKYLWSERWDVWGYVGIRLTQSGLQNCEFTSVI